MAKIKSYPKVDKFSPGDVLLKDGPDGTIRIIRLMAVGVCTP